MEISKNFKQMQKQITLCLMHQSISGISFDVDEYKKIWYSKVDVTICY